MIHRIIVTFDFVKSFFVLFMNLISIVSLITTNCGTIHNISSSPIFYSFKVNLQQSAIKKGRRGTKTGMPMGIGGRGAIMGGGNVPGAIGGLHKNHPHMAKLLHNRWVTLSMIFLVACYATL